MEETQEYSFGVRVVAMLLAFVTDNLWMIGAVCWGSFGDYKMAAFCLALAFYTRLTEIRDGMSSPEVTVNLNSVQQQPEGEKV